MNNVDILEEELRKDILYQIDMKLYDEFNDKFCEIEENLGTVYSYKDLEDLKKAESDTERTLLREAISTLIAENKELKENQKYIVDNYKTDCVEYEELIKRDYIPKSKVEEEIKELEKEQEEIKENEWILCSNINRIIIKVLQSLLEKE